MKSLRKIDAQSCEQELGKFRHTLALMVSTLREIFDESAYDRFLHRSQLAPSRGAYAAFRKEYEASKARRPRCC
jgi:hypothetical protein